MKLQIRMLLLGATLFVALGVMGGETVDQCMTNCPPGNNGCTQCCQSQYEPLTEACDSNCENANNAAFNAAYTKCGGKVIDGVPISPDQTCMASALIPYQKAVSACEDACNDAIQVAGGCPGEVPPQKCAYDCMSWNSASQSCVGAPMNGCVAGDGGGGGGAPAPAQNCQYNCQMWNPASGSCVGAPSNACGEMMMAIRPKPLVPAAATRSPAPTSAPAAGTCSFDCQTWDATTRTCVGSAKNGCAVRAARATALAAAANAHVSGLQSPPKKP